MDKRTLNVIRNALILALFIVAAWLIYDRVTAEPPPDDGDIKLVNKHMFVQHFLVVDVTHTEAPEGLLRFLGDLGIKEEFVVLLQGRVPAGFDLENLPPGSIWVSADRTQVQLTLPSPVIFEDNVSIDFENSRVLSQSDWCPDLICPTTDLEALLNEALPDGRDRMIDAARQNGILDHAAKAGKEHYQIYLESLGFEEVRVVVRGYGD